MNGDVQGELILHSKRKRQAREGIPGIGVKEPKRAIGDVRAHHRISTWETISSSVQQ